MLVKVKIRASGAYSDPNLWVHSEELPEGPLHDGDPKRKVQFRAADDEGRLYRVHGVWTAGEPGLLHADLVEYVNTVPSHPLVGPPWDEIARAISR